MFPYPSGAGLHVGHPLGYIGTDVYARFKRMTGHNVLHAMGYDAFGLPAEQYAVQTGQHPRVTTEANIANMRAPAAARSASATTRGAASPPPTSAYYRWTQWIFLQIFNSWYDDDADRARPITELVAELDEDRQPGATPDGRPWARARRASSGAGSSTRTASRTSHEAPVNWCPGLGTVLANEEVTADGRSRARQLPGLPAPAEAVDAAHHRVRRPAARRPRPARLARLDQADAAQLDRPLRRARQVDFPVAERRRRRHRGVHDAARHAVRRHLHGAGARAPAGRRASRRRPGPTATRRSTWTGGAADARRGGRGLPRQVAAAQRPRAPGRGPREDRRVHRRVRDEPGQRRARSRSSSPTTC